MAAAAGVTTLAGAVALYVGAVTHEIDERISQLKSTRTSQFLALYPSLDPGARFQEPSLRSFLTDQGYLEARGNEELRESEFRLSRSPSSVVLELHRPGFTGPGYPLQPLRAEVGFEPTPEGWLLKEIVTFPDRAPLTRIESLPKAIGSYFAGRTRTRSSVPLSEIPAALRLAVMAIEDVHFLEHRGVSVRSTVRALWRDLRAGAWVEGGSTITQQLMKNLFFSREKALSRKVKEALFALVTEARHDKEEILEAYLNEVYLGQWGSRQIHGVAEASAYYFSRPVETLSLSQSATLAAILQAPNAQDPHHHADKTTKRRNLVLRKMLAAEFILQDEHDAAMTEPLGVVPLDRTLSDASYFLDLVMERLAPEIRNRLDTEALTIYTTLNPYLQSEAGRAITAQLDRVRKASPAVREQEKKGNRLEGALVALDPRQCALLAVQGGHSYKRSQFNRILHGRRQPGSLFKPFVFLAALEQSGTSGKWTPLTAIEDSPFEWKYDRQIWKPKNYDGEYKGTVTVREALEQSRNVPTVRVAESVGIEPILGVLARAGITSALPRIPAISLGGKEVTPLEIAEAYSTLARLGSRCQLRSTLRVFDGNGNFLVEAPLVEAAALQAPAAFQLVHMLKGVFSHGTARSALASGVSLSGFAGKTGTTNEGNDAWFVGFSPDFLALVWVGFDEEAKLGMTGSSAALPIWSDFTRAARPLLPQSDFVKPDGLDAVDIDRTTRLRATSSCPEVQVEYFVPGTEPRESCSTHPGG